MLEGADDSDESISDSGSKHDTPEGVEDDNESIPGLITYDSDEDDNYEKIENEDRVESPPSAPYVTRSGRQVVPPTRLEPSMEGKSHNNVRKAVQLLQLGHEQAAGTKIAGFLFNQMSFRKGKAKHGNAALDVMMKELAQLNDMKVLDPVSPSDLTFEQRKNALRAVHLIKEKRDGSLKGRMCVDGSPQRSLYNREDTASPTVSSDALMLGLIVDAHERRDVAVADVRGAYLHAENDEDTIMVLEDDIVGIMESVDAVYTKFIHTDRKGKRKLYVHLTKALYGLVRSALLWYNLFSSTLINDDYVLNKYDACTVNKVVNGKQLTIQFYVDDLKIFHVDPEVVDKALSSLEERFGKLEASRGCNHEFLGMSIVFNKEERTVSINMKSYIEKAVQEFGEDLSKIKPVVSAAASYLFSYPVDDC